MIFFLHFFSSFQFLWYILEYNLHSQIFLLYFWYNHVGFKLRTRKNSQASRTTVGENETSRESNKRDPSKCRDKGEGTTRSIGWNLYSQWFFFYFSLLFNFCGIYWNIIYILKDSHCIPPLIFLLYIPEYNLYSQWFLHFFSHLHFCLSFY